MKKRPTPISTFHPDDVESSGSSPSSLSPSTTEVSESDSQLSFTSAEMPLTKAKLEHVLHRAKRGDIPSSAPVNGIFNFNWWKDTNDGSESEEENYPPTPMAMTPRLAESPTSPRPHTARFRDTRSPRPTPRTPSSARLARTPVSARQSAVRRPRTPLSATTFVQPSPRFETVSRSQLVLRPEQTPKPPRFRRRPTELKLSSSESSEDLSTSPSSASSSSVPPSPTDSLPPSPSALSVPQYTFMPQSPAKVFSPLPASPATPFSPSTRFCARSASRQVKQLEGYVSFGAIEGLGMPDMDDESDGEQVESKQASSRSKKDGSWTPKWLTPWK